MIRVAYIGNFKHSFCTESYVATALRANGCDVYQIQLDQGDVLNQLAQACRIAGDQIGLASTAMDMILYTRIHNRSALGPEWTEHWRALEKHGTVTAALHLDRFWDLEREHYIHDGDPLFTVQHCFTADGSNDERWQAAGVNHHWLAPAVDHGEAEHEGAYDPRLVCDILFVGSTGVYHREYPQRDQLVEHLRRVYGPRFRHVGHGGEPVIRGTRLNDLYRSAKVVVGDSCFANEAPVAHRRNGLYWSDRVPETLGRGGFLIHPWVPGMSPAQYTTGRHLVTHVPGDWEDLDAQIGAYIGNDGEREGIAAQGRAHVLRSHTWTVRMAELLDTVGLGDRVRVS